jgi:hypothetical protein
MYDGYLSIEETKLLRSVLFTDGLNFSPWKTKVPILAGDDADLRCQLQWWKTNPKVRKRERRPSESGLEKGS